MGVSAGPRPPWTFLTSHARVLVTLYRDPGARLRDVAATCVLTERTVQSIVADLEEAGYLRRVREGRRNHYRITPRHDVPPSGRGRPRRRGVPGPVHGAARPR
ncbi:helix-turn-helix transcriptional regulator [Streptomyces virginiae]|uniref:helix-turn-helix transcriptional regulator n=1 Tax=Streptomyces virginiae TaxID=1961 RepID=UPI00362D24D3